MDVKSSQKKVERHYMYKAAEGNAREAQRLYQERLGLCPRAGFRVFADTMHNAVR